LYDEITNAQKMLLKRRFTSEVQLSYLFGFS
jgi:hypothetical protein